MIPAATISDQYEALRAWAVGTVATHPPGLGILLQRGIPAWIETLCLAPSSPSASSVPLPSSPILAIPELAQVIASMLWEVRR